MKIIFLRRILSRIFIAITQLGLLLMSNMGAGVPHTALAATVASAKSTLDNQATYVTPKSSQELKQSTTTLTTTLSSDSPTTLGSNTHFTATLPPLSQNRHGWISTTIDPFINSGNGGLISSLAVGQDNLPVMSLWGQGGVLKIAKCEDITCTSVISNTIDNAGFVLITDSSLAIAPDDLPVITYLKSDVSGYKVMVAKCENATCTSVISTTVDAVDVNYLAHPQIRIGHDGLPIISYNHFVSFVGGDLRVAKCENSACTSMTNIPLDQNNGGAGQGFVGWYDSLAIPPDGLPVISYLGKAFADSNFSLKVAKCEDINCTSAISNSIDSLSFFGSTSIGVGSDNLPIISYSDSSTLTVAKCEDITCTTAITTTVASKSDSNASRDLFPSLSIGSDGLPIFSYITGVDNSGANGTLNVAQCENITCTSIVSTIVDTNVIFSTSLVIGPDGLPVISYYSESGLKVARVYTVTQTYALDFGDGSAIVTGRSPVSGIIRLGHTYNNAGSYTATITTTNGVQTTTAEVPILVNPNNVALSTTLSSDSPTMVGNITHLTATLPPIDPDQWGWIRNAFNQNVFTSFSALAIGTDGFPTISYTDKNRNLNVARCKNITCTSIITTTIDSFYTASLRSEVAIAPDGSPIVSYYGAPNRDLKLAKCENITCTSAITTTIDSAGIFDFLNDSSIQLGVDNLPIISYFDALNGTLNVAKCENITCTSFITATVDSPNSGLSGAHSSLAIGSDDLPIISYGYFRSAYENNLLIAKCESITCTSPLITTIDSEGYTDPPSMKIGSDGLPIISYMVVFTNSAKMKVAKCEDVACNSVIITTLDSANNLSTFSIVSSLAIGPHGLPIISYIDLSNRRLKLARCEDIDCTSATISNVSNVDFVQADISSLAIGSNGLPVISYDGIHGLTVASAYTVTPSYALDFGDGSAIATGTLPITGVIPFSHTYANAGSYTATVTTTQSTGTTTARTLVIVNSNQVSGLSGRLNATFSADVTYTLVVSNANPTQMLNNVIISGSLPTNSVLISTNGMSSTLGGDYGFGFVSMGPLDLLPNNVVTLTWTVRPITLYGDIITEGHAVGENSAFNLNTSVQIHRVYLSPVFRN